jgi:hypothetical protein
MEMLKIIVLEFNEELGLNQTIGEKDVSDLTIEEAHKEAKGFIKSLQTFKQNNISYHLEQDGKILAYL